MITIISAIIIWLYCILYSIIFLFVSHILELHLPSPQLAAMCLATIKQTPEHSSVDDWDECNVATTNLLQQKRWCWDVLPTLFSSYLLILVNSIWIHVFMLFLIGYWNSTLLLNFIQFYFTISSFSHFIQPFIRQLTI